MILSVNTDVYALYIDSNKSLNVYLDDEKFDDFYEKNFRGMKMAKNWASPPLKLSGATLPLKDFVSGILAAPLVSENARITLVPILTSYVEFLPAIKLRGIPYYFLNVIKMVDCLDIKNSEIDYTSDNSGRILNVRQFSFVQTKLPNAPIFKVPEDPGIIFVRDPFIKVILNNKLTGIGVQNPSQLTIMKPAVSAYVGLPISRKK